MFAKSLWSSGGQSNSSPVSNLANVYVNRSLFLFAEDALFTNLADVTLDDVIVAYWIVISNINEC